MTLVELEPIVNAALVALEWRHAGTRWRQGLLEEREAIVNALPLAGSYGVEEAPLKARLEQIEIEWQGDVTADRVPQHPLRSVPMDLVTVAVVRRALRLPENFPVLSVKVAPSAEQIAEVVEAIASRWSSPLGPVVDREPVVL